MSQQEREVTCRACALGTKVYDYATGARGTYSIGRDRDGIREYWTPTGWEAFAYVFNDLALAEAVCELIHGEASAKLWMERFRP